MMHFKLGRTLFLAAGLAWAAISGPAVANPTPVAAGPVASITPLPPSPSPAPGASPAPIVLPGGMPPSYQPHAIQTEIPPPVNLPPPATPPPGMAERPLTAQEAAEIALHLSPSIPNAQGQVTATRGLVQQARAAEWPTVTFSESYTNVLESRSGQASSASIVNTPTSSVGGARGSSAASFNSAQSNFALVSEGYILSASIKQLVYDFNHTRSLVRQAIENRKAATAGLTKAQLDLVFNVKQAFYAYVQDLRTVDVDGENVKDQQSHLAQARARFKAGVGLPSDVVRAETAVSDAILTLVQARNTADVARVNLAALMGIDPRTPIVPATSAEPALAIPDVAGLFATALRMRPEMVQAEATVRANEYGLSAAVTNNVPTFSLNVNYLARGQQIYPDSDTTSLVAQVQWTPFDGGLTPGKVLQARGNLQSARAQLEQERLTVLSDVSQGYFNLKLAEQRLATAHDEVANARESARLAEGRFRAGLGIFLDVLDAQSALITAETNLVNAQSAVDQARAQLVHAIGAPLGAAVPTAPPAPRK